jgi:hypothetical protein
MLRINAIHYHCYIFVIISNVQSTKFCTYIPDITIQYTKSTTVSVHSSEWGPLTPLPQASVHCPCPLLNQTGHTRLRVRGWGGPNLDDLASMAREYFRMKYKFYKRRKLRTQQAEQVNT